MRQKKLRNGVHIVSLRMDGVSVVPASVLEFLETLAKDFRVSKLIIFGSRACGDHEEFSDVDLAIEADAFCRADWVALREKAYYDVRTVLNISVVDFLRNPERIRKHIIKNGVIIYEQQKKG